MFKTYSRNICPLNSTTNDYLLKLKYLSIAQYLHKSYHTVMLPLKQKMASWNYLQCTLMKQINTKRLVLK